MNPTKEPVVPPGPSIEEASRGLKVPGLRWWIVTLLFGAAVLNYVDRQTLSVLAEKTIQPDLGMNDRDYANVTNLFLVAYTLSYLVSGRIVDRFGTRVGMVVFVIWWSLANILTAAATGVKSMGFFRFLLGLGEAGVWPAASKAVSEWFPARERGLAIGFYTMGSTLGATLAPSLVIPLAAYPWAEKLPWITGILSHGTGWRVAFILTGAAGLVWAIPWLWLYREPRQSRLLGARELQLIEEKPAGDPPSSNSPESPWTWSQVLRFKGTWLLLVGRLITDPVWYFYQFWFPKYLGSDRHLTQEQVKITWIVYAAAGLGSLLGGWLSGRMIKQGKAPATSRIWVMLGCACLMPLAPLISSATSLDLSLTITAITVVASLAWLINISSLIVDLVPKHSLGTVFSLVATGSTIGGIVMNMIVARMVSGPSSKPTGFLDQAIQSVFGGLMKLVEGHGYGQWFWIMAFLHPIAWLVLYFGKIHRQVPRTA